MRNLTLVLIFLFGLILKVSAAAGAEAELNAAKHSVVRELTEDPAQVRVSSEPIEVSEDAAEVNNAEKVAMAPTPSPIPAEGNDILAPVPVETPMARPEQSTNIQNRNNIIVAQPVQQTAPVVAYGHDRYYSGNNEDASSVLSAHEHSEDYAFKARLTPMVGGSLYSNYWNSVNVTNSFSLGLGLEIPVSYLTSVEAEGDYSRNWISYYTYATGSNVSHHFGQASLGGNLKFYLTKQVFRPYVGAGLMALNYHHMYSSAYNYYYDQWVGAGQLIAGADIAVSDKITIGARGAWIVPMFNRADAGYGNLTQGGYEEASVINNSFYKILGTISFAL